MKIGETVELAADIPSLGWKEGDRILIGRVRGSAPCVVLDVQNLDSGGTLSNMAKPLARERACA